MAEVFAVVGYYTLPAPNGVDESEAEVVFSVFSTEEKAQTFLTKFLASDEALDYVRAGIERIEVDEDEDMRLLYTVYYNAPENSSSIAEGHFTTDDLPRLAAEVPTPVVMYAMDSVIGNGYGWTYQEAEDNLREAVEAFYVLPEAKRVRY